MPNENKLLKHKKKPYRYPCQHCNSGNTKMVRRDSNGHGTTRENRIHSTVYICRTCGEYSVRRTQPGPATLTTLKKIDLGIYGLPVPEEAREQERRRRAQQILKKPVRGK